MSNSPHYSISTPENVDLHLELAGMGCRIYAAFLDMVMIYLALFVVIIVAVGIASFVTAMDMPMESKTTLYYYVAGVSILIAFIIQFGYFILFEKLWNGQTPGKKFADIRVIEANGQPVNWASVIIRNLVRIIDAGVLMIGVVFMIFDKNERRLGDLMGGTLVIRERRPELAGRSLQISTELPTTSFVDAGQLSLDEYQLLLAFLRKRHKMEPSSRTRVAKDLELYFRTKLNPENKGESSENFLEKVYLSYAELAGTKDA